MSFVIETAGGLASTGEKRILTLLVNIKIYGFIYYSLKNFMKNAVFSWEALMMLKMLKKSSKTIKKINELLNIIIFLSYIYM